MQDNPLRVEAVVNGLREEILNGILERESRLPSERELAEKFDVSRVTVRTAISRLSQLGFVRTVPKSGTYVNDYLENASVDLLVDIIKNSRKVDNEMLLALTDVRRLIEVYSAGKCAQKITDDERFRLEALVADMENHAEDPFMIAEKDYAFHMEIVRIGGNPVLRVLMNSTSSIFRYYLNYLVMHFAQVQKNAARIDLICQRATVYYLQDKPKEVANGTIHDYRGLSQQSSRIR